MKTRLVTQYRQSQPLSAMLEMTIIAQDPSVHRQRFVDPQRKILTTKVRIPPEWLEPGPRSHRFHVVDYDETKGAYVKPRELMKRTNKPGWPPYEDRFAEAADDMLAADPHFRALNTFVIATRVLTAFESALGRRVPWGFDG